MGINSYAQNFEDVMLWRALGDIPNGFYIDVGANDPIVDSVSRAFYEHGWRGIHIEATPQYAQLLRENRPDETVLQVALSDLHGMITFYEIPQTGISTGDKSIAEEHIQRGFPVQEIIVPCMTLSDVFDQIGSRDIHWLKIDVEGFEDKVLRGWGNHQTRPWILVIESTLPLTTIETYQQWEEILLERDYEPVYFDGLNRYYISSEHLELKVFFNSPPNVFDGFTLNGTASASMHQLIQKRYEDEVQNIGRLNREIEELKDELNQKGDESTKDLLTLVEREKEWSGKEHSLNSLIIQTQNMKHSEAQKHLESLVVREKEFNEKLLQLRDESQAQTQKVAQQYREKSIALNGQFQTRESELLSQIDTIRHELNQKSDESTKHLLTLIEREKEFASELFQLRKSAEAQRHSIESQHKEAMSELSNEYKKDEENLISQIENIRIELKAQTELSAEYLARLARRENEFAIELSKLRENADVQLQSIESENKEAITALLAERVLREENLLSQIENIRSELRTQTNLSAEHLSTLARREEEFARELRYISNEKYAAELTNKDFSHLLTTAQQLESQLHSELAFRQQMLNDLSQQLTRLRGSVSWKLTAPLRAIGSLFTSAPQESSQSEVDPPPIDESLTTLEPIEKLISDYEETIMPSCPTVAASSLDELLAYYDTDFVNCAYMTLLGRMPDPDGMRYYLGRLRTGRAKIAIIDQLVSSVEARNYNANVADLKQVLGQYRWEKMPIIGRILKSIFRQDEFSRQIRQMENSIYLIGKNMNHRFDAVEQQIKQISYTLVAQSDAQILGADIHTTENSPDLSHLSPLARKIYTMLKNAQGNK